jgi:hypothetical protein
MAVIRLLKCTTSSSRMVEDPRVNILLFGKLVGCWTKYIHKQGNYIDYNLCLTEVCLR